MMLETMSLERYDREPEARYRNQTGSHLNDGLQTERRPQRLYLFCNGNRHYKGKVVLVNMRQYRNFGDFLNDVTNRLQPTLPLAHGVRQVFTPVNGRRLRRLSDLEDGQSYVCAGFETFKPMPYEDLTDKTHAPPIGGKRKKSLRENTKSDSARSSTLEPSPRSSQQPPPPPHPARPYVARQRVIRGHDVTPTPPGSKVRPRIITIYRNGSNPLQNVKILFNRKSVQSYEQFLNDVSDAFESSSTSSLPSNRLRKLMSVGGRDVGGVSDLFREDELFIGTGPERVEMDTVRQVLQLLYPNSVYGDTLMRLWEKRLTDAATAGGVGTSEKQVTSKADLDGGGTGTEAEEGASVQPRRRKGPKMPRRFMEKRAEETARLSNFSVLPSIQGDRHGHVTGNGASTEVQAERRRAELSRFNSSRRSSAAGDAKVFQGQVRGNLGHRSGDVSRPEVSLGLPKEREGRTVVTDGTNRGPAGSEPLKGAQHTEAPSEDAPEVVSRPGTGSRHRDPPATLTRDSRIFSPPLTHRQRSGDRTARNQSEPHEDSVNNNKNENSWNNEDNEIDPVRTFSGVDSPRGNATPEPVVPDSRTDADEGSRMSPEVPQTPVEGDQTPVATHQRHVPSYLVIEEKYELGRILGDGNFAVVKHCKERETGKEFAMKVVDKVKLRGKEDLIENEILIMKACHHQNIVKLFLEYETNSEIFLLMELVGGGDLFDFISQHAPFNEVEAAGMVYDLGKALAYLHSRAVVHRDVKPENIVVQHGDSDLFCLKLADFGLATEVRGPLSTVCGTPTYVAPEILAEIGYGLEIDMWATGVILYILLCGFAPFRGEDPDQLDLFEAIKSGEFEFTSPYWDKASDGVRDLITHLLQVDAGKRYTAIDVICHPFIVTCAGTFNPPSMEQLRNNLRNELNKDALVHRNSFAAVLAQLK